MFRASLVTIFSLLLLLLVASFLFLFPFFPFFPHLNYLLGQSQPTSYLLLLQNDTEMRANGGFAGSYAKINLNFSHFDINFQDIYVPNGQLTGYVTPPAPIQAAFQHGTWELANADWEPDFPTAAKTIRWFFEKGGETNPDILATISVSTIKDILHLLGPISIQEYQATLDENNFYHFLQSKVETNFFPGSTQKKDTLTVIGKALKDKITHLNFIQYIQILNLIKRELNQQNILLNSTNKDFQNFLISHHFAGQIKPGPLDSYLLVETNLGANKANCCTETTTTHTISRVNSSYLHQVHVKINNKSDSANPNPPFTYSGHYLAYLRFYLPQDSFDLSLTPNQSSPSGGLSNIFFDNQVTIKDNLGFKEVGFFHITAAGTTSTIDLSYLTATGSADRPYQLDILKQNGQRRSPSLIQYQNRTFNTDLLTHFSIQDRP